MLLLPLKGLVNWSFAKENWFRNSTIIPCPSGTNNSVIPSAETIEVMQIKIHEWHFTAQRWHELAVLLRSAVMIKQN